MYVQSVDKNRGADFSSAYTHPLHIDIFVQLWSSKIFNNPPLDYINQFDTIPSATVLYSLPPLKAQ